MIRVEGKTIPLAAVTALLLRSADISKRLRTVAGQSIIKPPAIDLEAADHIDKLAALLAELLDTPQSKKE